MTRLANMGDVVHINAFSDAWAKVFRADDEVNGTTLVVFANRRSSEYEIIQTNDYGESITTHMTPELGAAFLEALLKGKRIV